MLAVLKREWKSYFQNITGWLFIALILALYGLYFFVYNLRGGSPYISYSISAIAFILLIAVPVLTMRSIAEERHSRTDQLIMTAPVSLGKIILGKYFAMAGIFTAAMAVIAVSPLTLSLLGEVPLAESYVAILGFWLYGCACIAVGMFISSLTESQVIAAVLTFGCLFLGYMMSSITQLISQSGNLLTKILGVYDLYIPMYAFMSGCLDFKALVYFLSLIALLLFFTYQSIQKRRWSISTKKIGTGVFSVGMIAAAVVVAVIANLLMAELPEAITSIDATANQLYSLTDETKEYAKTLEEDVTIYVLAAEQSADETLKETLERYESLSEHIFVEYKNPSVNPAFYQQYTDTAPSTNSLIIVSEKRVRVIDYNDIYEYSYDYYTYSSTIEGYDAEGQITSAIQYVTLESEELPVIYEITGHGEQSISGGFKEAVEKANVTLSELTLLSEDAVPKDASAIIINGPTSDFSTDDTKKVLDYLENGGKAIITTNFQYKNLENFENVLAAYEVKRLDGLVMENDGNYFYGNTPYYLLPNTNASSYTTSVGNRYVFAPFCEAFSYPTEAETVGYTTLLETTDQAVSKIDFANADTSEWEDGDLSGPFCIGLAIEKSVGENTTQIVLLGSTEMLTDNANQVVSGNNISMFSDMLNSIVSTEELSVSVIPVKEYTLGTITVTSTATILGGMLAAIFIPVILILMGIVIWAIRRKK